MLDNQTVWITGESTAIAYMDTQDIAKFAVRALEVPETVGLLGLTFKPDPMICAMPQL